MIDFEYFREVSMSLSILDFIIVFLAGICLGTLYFGGLWMTLQRLPRWRRPFLGMGLSWALRLVILLAGGTLLLRYTSLPLIVAIALLAVGLWLVRLGMVTHVIRDA